MTDEQKIDLQKRLLSNLLEWMKTNQGVPVVTGAVGARGHIRNTRQFYIHQYGPNTVCRNEGSCVPESVANGVAALSNPEDALNVAKYFERNPKLFTFLKQLFVVLPKLPVSLTVRRISQAQRDLFGPNPFGWISNMKMGIWIVRLKQHGIVEHCVAIDANRQIILDSAARYPFMLCEEILKRLGGVNAKTLQVAKVRELFLQTKMSNKRSGKKRNRE